MTLSHGEPLTCVALASSLGSGGMPRAARASASRCAKTDGQPPSSRNSASSTTRCVDPSVGRSLSRKCSKSRAVGRAVGRFLDGWMDGWIGRWVASHVFVFKV